jgi:hypothetical protein
MIKLLSMTVHMEVKIVMGREGRWGGAGRFEGGREGM